MSPVVRALQPRPLIFGRVQSCLDSLSRYPHLIPREPSRWGPVVDFLADGRKTKELWTKWATTGYLDRAAAREVYPLKIVWSQEAPSIGLEIPGWHPSFELWPEFEKRVRALTPGGTGKPTELSVKIQEFPPREIVIEDRVFRKKPDARFGKR